MVAAAEVGFPGGMWGVALTLVDTASACMCVDQVVFVGVRTPHAHPSHALHTLSTHSPHARLVTHTLLRPRHVSRNNEQ